MMKLCAPSIAFICAMSILPHKELRFIFHCLPILIVPAAVLIAKNLKSSNKPRRTIFILILLMILSTSTMITIFKIVISQSNYPAGWALLESQKLVKEPTSIYIDVFSSMNGISRFTQFREDWTFDKSENIKDAQDLKRFPHLLVRDPEHFIPLGFTIVKSWDAYDGLRCDFVSWLRNPTLILPCALTMTPKVYLLKNQ